MTEEQQKQEEQKETTQIQQESTTKVYDTLGIVNQLSSEIKGFGDQLKNLHNRMDLKMEEKMAAFTQNLEGTLGGILTTHKEAYKKQLEELSKNPDFIKDVANALANQGQAEQLQLNKEIEDVANKIIEGNK